tara:strand:- start:2921 stop:3232 length:312 start_codon:yes stop_codon:yes gene_type:complete
VVARAGDPVTRHLHARPPVLLPFQGRHQEDIMATLTQSVPSSDSYFEALAVAERRALHSFFDQHVVEDDDLGHFAFDEGDYNALPVHLASRIVHTVPGAMLEF